MKGNKKMSDISGSDGVINTLQPTELEKGCFINRELSWLQFNLRVLCEAAEKSVPLLERLKFISIYYSNLHEFFMVRVGTIIHRTAIVPGYCDSKTGLTGAEMLRQILAEVKTQQSEAEKFYKKIVSKLKESGVDILNFKNISKVDEILAKKFYTDVADTMSVYVVDSKHPVPFIGNEEEYVVSLLKKGRGYALGFIPMTGLPKFKTFEVNGRQKIVIMSELIAHFAPKMLKKYDVKGTAVIRMTRNADVVLDDDFYAEGFNFRKTMEKMLSKRKRQMPVRLQIKGKINAKFRTTLLARLGVDPDYVFESTVLPMNYSFTKGIRHSSDMVYKDQRPVRSVKLHKGEYFNYLEKNDMLLSFPFQSMTPFIEMIYEAGDDPFVTSIKITLYRLAGASKLAAALAYAADHGKDVLCLLELRARFDEQNNIDYSQVLEEAGCRIIYGLPEQKVHSKLCVITRQNGDETIYITQVGTGNYNEITSELYCDLSIITSDYQTGVDAVQTFDALEREEIPPMMEKLWVAPLGFKPRMLELMDGEIAKGRDGFVSLKFNSLNDADIMHKLIECSQAGNTVELFIRGICCLRSGVPGYTENITVRSVIGRYLEHSRIYVFGKGEDQRIFIGSGDLLNRNTTRRVEVFKEVLTEETRAQTLEVMNAFRNDREKGWLMLSDGTYVREPGNEGTSSQDYLYGYFAKQIVE